jgi:hypothetical protein
MVMLMLVRISVLTFFLSKKSDLSTSVDTSMGVEFYSPIEIFLDHFCQKAQNEIGSLR